MKINLQYKLVRIISALLVVKDEVTKEEFWVQFNLVIGVLGSNERVIVGGYFIVLDRRFVLSIPWSIRQHQKKKIVQCSKRLLEEKGRASFSREFYGTCK